MPILTINDLDAALQDGEQGQAAIQKALDQVTILGDLEQYFQWMDSNEVTTNVQVALRRQKERGKGIHPSAACKVGVCPLRLYFDCTHEVKPSRKFELRLQWIFDFGTLLHETLQTHLEAMYGDQFQKEMKVEVPDFHVYGRTDGAFLFSAVRFVLEIKTIKEGGNFGWDKVTQVPMLDNVRQTTIYMRGTNIPFGLIVYINKNTSELKEHVITYSSEVWDSVVKDIQPAIDAAYHNGPRPLGKTGFACRSCDYHHGCEDARRAETSARTDTRTWKR